MAIATSLASLIGVFFVAKFSDKPAIKFNKDIRDKIFKYAFNIWLTSLMWNLMWSRGEVPFIRIYYGDIGLAQYSVALTLFGGVIMFVMLAVQAVAPEIARLLGDNDKDSALKICRDSIDLQLVLSGFGGLLL